MRSKQQGIGLVEILIAMVLGLLLTIAMAEVFLNSKQAYRSQEAMARVQENGRFTMEIMSREIRMAGFQGCANLDSAVPNVIADPAPGMGFSASEAILGYELSDSGTWSSTYASPPASVLKGTDSTIVSRASDCGAYLVGNLASDNANIQINPDNTCNFKQNEILIISDCKNTDVFRASSVSKGSSKITIAHANNVNTTNRLSTLYGEDAQIYKFLQTEFFIRENSYGQPTIYMRENGGTPLELIEGVEGMEIQYGEDTTSDYAADAYVDAPAVADWSKVVGVRLTIFLRSIRDNVALSERAYTYNGGRSSMSDKRLTQSITATIGLRNRAP
ncbi:PilW family protein [Solemya velesiana gill symbiont]|nr:PilW family protein [Solemya velesiana gill symbiont]